MPLKVEDSWRIVDGENDSFDTSILPSADSDDILLPLSSENTSSGFPSQLSSQSQGASQDSIRDFVKHQEDDKVILREPFRPSVPSVASLSPRHNTYRTPDPEFTMPILDTNGDDDQQNHSSGRSSATVRPNGTRRRRGAAAPTSSSPTSRSPVQRSAMRRRIAKEKHAEMDHGPSTMAEVSNWLYSVVALAFRLAKRPLALFLAIYVLCGALVMTQNMLQHSILVALSPVCSIPGASYLNLPFCPDWMPGTGSKMAAPIEFEQLVNAQSKFEHVLEKSADGVSLPFEMKSSESSIRDLRNLVQHSQLESRDALVFEFDAYIEAASSTVDALSRFNSHVASAVDRVLIMNRWTSQTIASIQESPSDSVVSSISNWLFYPFEPSGTTMRELALRNKYIAHTDFLSERINDLVSEARDLLELISTAEGRLYAIQDITSQSSASVETHRSQIFYSLWTLVGANTGKLRNLSQRLALLKQVDYQRLWAVTLVTSLVVELEAIKANLGSLRAQMENPPATLDPWDPAAAQLPLSVHVETINSGVERLEAARNRIRAAENKRHQDIVARRGVRPDPGLLDPPKK